MLLNQEDIIVRHAFEPAERNRDKYGGSEAFCQS